MEQATTKKNLLQLAAERKAAAQASGVKTAVFTKGTSQTVGSPRADFAVRPTKRGGRNAQGKP